MATDINLRTNIELGVVPTHIKFVGGLVPDEEGRLPREADGQLSIVAEMKRLMDLSRVKISSAQIPSFPGANADDVHELITGLKDLGLIVHLIMMVGGADPMNPADEDAVVAMLTESLNAAKTHGIAHVASTSLEEWMKEDATRKEGADLDAAVAQLAKLHARAYQDAGVEGSSIEAWHFEFLRDTEFQTFTDLGRVAKVAAATNAIIGKPFFKAMVDAAHCGDSTLSIPENEALIAELAASDELGLFHASAKTTRGCLSTDDGWIGALMTACLRTGKCQQVFVELFHHEDPALEGLRNADPNHGIDTTDGRSYTQTVADGLEATARRLNNLVARGIIPGS
jgi:hypothetical protein